MVRTIEHDREKNNRPTTSYSFDRKTFVEIFDADFLRRLSVLNGFIKDSNQNFEGSVCYWHGTNGFLDSVPDISLAPSRRNLWRAVRHKRSLLEVGVNACHSALLALSSNNDLRYHGVDINWHRYTQNCVDFMQSEFPGRFYFTPGDSREVLPRLATHRAHESYDIFHVDGGHTEELCRTDISNCLRLSECKPGKHLLLDDINAAWIYDVYCEFISLGRLRTESFFNDWEDVNRNVLCYIEVG